MLGSRTVKIQKETSKLHKLKTMDALTRLNSPSLCTFFDPQKYLLPIHPSTKVREKVTNLFRCIVITLYPANRQNFMLRAPKLDLR